MNNKFNYSGSPYFRVRHARPPVKPGDRSGIHEEFNAGFPLKPVLECINRGTCGNDNSFAYEHRNKLSTKGGK